jgi:hypothetical protein
MYAVWDGRGWSDPVDVYVSSQKQNLTSPQAEVDANGVLHVVWFEGADRLMYARAHVLQAQFAQNWAEAVETRTPALLRMGLTSLPVNPAPFTCFMPGDRAFAS